ncbi:astacin, partial [Necator americanus]
MHELMHVIGLHHEHSRYDRDNFVKVHYENIKKDEWYNFEKVNADKFTTHGVPYDYMSIMHYKKDTFARPGKISIETLNPSYQ